MQRDIQFAQQDAQTEVNDLTNELQSDFQVKLNPILEQVRVEKGLLHHFQPPRRGLSSPPTPRSISSAEVVKRFDAAMKSAPKK